MPLKKAGTVFSTNHIIHIIMELQELKQEEIVAIYGGNEISETVLFWAGAISKGLAYFASGARDGGYSYCKCGY
jgi:hypothetical protein